MTDVYVHVGLPKTGSTFMQELCFPHLKGVHFIHMKPQVSATGITERLWRVVDAYPLFMNMNENRAEIGRFLQETAEDKLLISSERLFGDLMLGFRDHYRITEGVHELFPAAKIILIIRRQDELLESLYRQFIRAYFSPKVDGFLEYMDHRFEKAIWASHVYPRISVWRLDYQVYVQNYTAMFGRQNVLVLPYELLRTDPQKFHSQLANFMNIEPYDLPETVVNRGYSMLSCRVALLLNRFVRAPRRDKRPWQFIPSEPLTSYLHRRTNRDWRHRILASLNRRLSLRYVLENYVNRIRSPQGKFINDEKRLMIMNIHRDSNRKLDEEYDLDLQRYGYY